MISWFVQHWPHPDWGSEKNIKLQTQLFEKGQVAVHYQDIASVDLNRYNEYSQKFIRKFVELAKEGGYICANYPPIKRMLIGKVLPNSEIRFDSDSPILKRLTLSEWKPVDQEMRVRFLVCAPTRATLSRWKIIGSRLEDLVKKRRCKDWGSLLPYEQETICQEYLRAKHRLVHLLVPFGRSLEDLDIIGIGKVGDPIAAQVTFTQSVPKLEKKAQVLNAYKGSLFFFSPNSEHLPMFKKKYPRIRFVPTEEVWQWLNTKPAYAKAMFLTA